jgi:hypothetical protein
VRWRGLASAAPLLGGAVTTCVKLAVPECVSRKKRARLSSASARHGSAVSSALAATAANANTRRAAAPAKNDFT